MRVTLLAIATLAAFAAVGTEASKSSSSSKSNKNGGGGFTITVNGPGVPAPPAPPAPVPSPPVTGQLKSIFCNVCGQNKVVTCGLYNPQCFNYNQAVCGVATCSTTLVDVVAATPTLSSLLSSVVTTGLANTLASAGPFTVFAPNNAAFAAIAQLASTLSVQQLRNVLLLHVASGVRITAADLYDGMVINTLGGTLIVRKHMYWYGVGWKITNADGTSSANIILADQFADNGVAHVIDGVILPPSNTPVYTPAPPAPPVYTPAPPAPPVYTPAPAPSPTVCSQTRKRHCKTQLTNGACAWNGDVRQCMAANYVTPCGQQRKRSCKASNSCTWQNGIGCSAQSAVPPPVPSPAPAPSQCSYFNQNKCNRASNCRWQNRKQRCLTRY